MNERTVVRARADASSLLCPKPLVFSKGSQPVQVTRAAFMIVLGVRLALHPGPGGVKDELPPCEKSEGERVSVR